MCWGPRSIFISTFLVISMLFGSSIAESSVWPIFFSYVKRLQDRLDHFFHILHCFGLFCLKVYVVGQIHK